MFQDMDADDDREINLLEFTAFVARGMGVLPPPGGLPLAMPPPTLALLSSTTAKHSPRPLNARAVGALADMRALPPSNWLTSWRSRGGQQTQCLRPSGIERSGPEFLRQQIRLVLGRDKGPFGDPLWSDEPAHSTWPSVEASMGQVHAANGSGAAAQRDTGSGSRGGGVDTQVRLRFERLGAGMGDSRLLSLAPLLRCAPAIAEINLGHCRLTDASMSALAAGLVPLCELRSLGLFGNRIGDVGCEVLATALPHPTMQRLDLMGNRAITARGVGQLELAKRSALPGGQGGALTGLEKSAIKDRALAATIAACALIAPNIYWR